MNKQDESYWTDREVAMVFQISWATLRRWRTQGKGPRYSRLGRSIRYRVTDVREWAAHQPTGGEVEIRI
jgi:predicted DNA-binding transcriptional regulator AlpA